MLQAMDGPLSPLVKAFIQEYRMDDPDALALKARKYPHVPIDFVARQIKGWRRIQKKLPNWAINEDIIYPSTLPLEQCSSEVTASYKAGLFKGRIAADLTGGFGVDAYFLAQSFDKVFYLERDSELASASQVEFPHSWHWRAERSRCWRWIKLAGIL